MVLLDRQVLLGSGQRLLKHIDGLARTGEAIHQELLAGLAGGDQRLKLILRVVIIAGGVFADQLVGGGRVLFPGR